MGYPRDTLSTTFNPILPFPILPYHHQTLILSSFPHPSPPPPFLPTKVPNCDTLHDLIRDFRESRKIILNVEHKLMQQIAPNQTYEMLPHAHKLEVGGVTVCQPTPSTHSVNTS